MADRCDRATLGVSGPREALDRALAELGGIGWWARRDETLALVRCEAADAGECLALLGRADDTSVTDLGGHYTGIGLIGPSAAELAGSQRLDPAPLVLREGAERIELLVEVGSGSALWERLLEAGRPLRLACVGFDALEHLAASATTS